MDKGSIYVRAGLGIGLALLTSLSIYSYKLARGADFPQQAEEAVKGQSVKIEAVLQSEKLVIRAEADGLIKQINVDPLMGVKGGQELVVLENVQLEGEVAEAQAALELAKTKLKKLQNPAKATESKIQQLELKKSEVIFQNAQGALSEIKPLLEAATRNSKEIDEKILSSRRRLEKVLAEHRKHTTPPAGDSSTATHGGASHTAMEGHADMCAVFDQHLSEIHRLLNIITENQLETESIKLSIEQIQYRNSLLQLKQDIKNLIIMVEEARINEEIAKAKISALAQGSQQTDLNIAHAEIKQAEVALSVAKNRLAATKALAPYPGVVDSIEAQPGEIIEKGMPLLTIRKPYAMKFSISVSQADFGFIKSGDKVAFTVEGQPGVHYKGQVRQVDVVLQNTKTITITNKSLPFYKLLVVVDNSSGLLEDNMKVTSVVKE